MENCNKCGSENVYSRASLVVVEDECQDCGYTERNL